MYLSLCGFILFQLKDSSEVCLPSLKGLQLLVGDGSDANSVNILLSGCPILEDLELSFCHFSFAKLRVQTSLLKRLAITFAYEAGGCVEIDAPGLKYLSLSNGTAFGNLHNVKEAYLAEFSTPESESVFRLLNLLQALSGIKHLMLDHYITERLLDAPFLDFPEFCYLLHLDIGLPSFNMVIVFNMLQKCPMLQTLIILQCKEPEPVIDDSFSYGWVAKLKTVAKCLKSPLYGWLVKPNSVPTCLASHLTFIHYKAFQGNRHELEFIRYVLQNGLLLKMMVINGIYLLDRPEEWVEFISNMPRGSAMCQFQFH
ncbi:putative FBD domain, leucine-rich repeat domain, L domain-containing protein [Medicago truncatula]|uniref:Putative FBD domain, leucine-rich repeat domain, L domain-containing protein n=1 Tax=Medicago truncatula TaxID=3880 RepID=A0A396I1P4_MEDTR|nr:putative FBD domain, leucine-rich repeat domain, L domain-containing protein [Medicago truncatula]